VDAGNFTVEAKMPGSQNGLLSTVYPAMQQLALISNNIRIGNDKYFSEILVGYNQEWSFQAFVFASSKGGDRGESYLIKSDESDRTLSFTILPAQHTSHAKGIQCRHCLPSESGREATEGRKRRIKREIRREVGIKWTEVFCGTRQCPKSVQHQSQIKSSRNKVQLGEYVPVGENSKKISLATKSSRFLCEA
jgi:hypothetical protein